MYVLTASASVFTMNSPFKLIRVELSHLRWRGRCRLHGGLSFQLEAMQTLGIARQYSRNTLIATSRFNTASRAWYTSPIPPSPSCATILKESSQVPAASGIGDVDYNLSQIQ